MVTDDPDSYLAEFGEAAVVNGYQCLAIFDYEYAPLMGDFAEGRTITACIKTPDFATSQADHADPVVVRGKTYRIVGIQPIQDGNFTDLVLSE